MMCFLIVLPCFCFSKMNSRFVCFQSRDFFPEFFPRTFLPLFFSRTFFPRTFLPDFLSLIFPVLFSRNLFSRILFSIFSRTYFPSVSMAAVAALRYMTAAVAAAARYPRAVRSSHAHREKISTGKKYKKITGQNTGKNIREKSTVIYEKQYGGKVQGKKYGKKSTKKKVRKKNTGKQSTGTKLRETVT